MGRKALVSFCSRDPTTENLSARGGSWPLQGRLVQVCLQVFAESSKKSIKMAFIYFIYEISRFDRPSLWYLVSLNLNLFGKNMVTNLLTWFADIGSLNPWRIGSLLFQTCIRRPWHRLRNNQQLLHDFAYTWPQVLNNLVKMNVLPMYPGVPEVSWEFSGRHSLAMPKSVILRYPDNFRKIWWVTIFL